MVVLNSPTLYRAFTLKLGDGVRGYVNKTLDYDTEPSAHAEYLIVNRNCSRPVIKKRKKKR